LENYNFFYIKNEGFFEVFKLLKLENDTVYVRSYWPIYEEPTAISIVNLDVKSACSLIEKDEFEKGRAFAFEIVTPEDEKEIEQFKAIVQGQEARKNKLAELIEAADQAIENKEFEQAVAILTEAAPFNKFNLTVFEKRALCYVQLGKRFEAEQDIDFVLMMDSGNEVAMGLKKLIQV
jgi:hypothetical protein